MDSIRTITNRMGSPVRSAARYIGGSLDESVREFGFLGNVLADMVGNGSTGSSDSGRDSRRNSGTTVGGLFGTGAVLSSLNVMTGLLSSINSTLKSIYQDQIDQRRGEAYKAEELKTAEPLGALTPSSLVDSRDKEDRSALGMLATVIATSIGDMINKITSLPDLLMKGLGGLPGILMGAIKAGLVGAAGYFGYEFGKNIVVPAIDSLIQRITGDKNQTLGGAAFDVIDKLKGVLPGLQSSEEKQRATDLANAKALMNQRLKEQGGLTPKQAEFFRGQGLEVDSSKVSENIQRSTTPPVAALKPLPMDEVLAANERRTFGRADPTLGGIDFEAYKEAIGKRESNNNYKAENTLGYLGRYQMGAAALADVGLMIPKPVGKNNKEKINNPANWRGGLSKQEFLNNPALQDDAFKRYTVMNYKTATSKRVGLITKEDTVDKIAAKLAASHLQGVGGAKKYFESNVDLQDAYGTKASEYAKLGAASQRASSLASSASPSTPAVMQKGEVIGALSSGSPNNINNITAPSISPTVVNGAGGSPSIPSLDTSMMDDTMVDIRSIVAYAQ